MARATDYFDDWFKAQQELLSTWTEQVKKMQDTIFSSPAGGGEKTWQALWQPYLEYFKERPSAPAGPAKAEGGGRALQEAAQRAAESQNIYARLFEMWAPLWQVLQEKALDVACYQELLDPAKLKDLTDRTFGLRPGAVKEFYDHVQKNLDTAVDTSSKFIEPWTEAFERNMAVIPPLIQGNPGALLNIFHNNYSAFDSTFGRAFNIPPVGKDREKIRLLQRTYDDMAVYMAKYIEYQHIMYLTSQRALEKLIRIVARKIKADELNSFDQVFELWVDINEKEYLELGRTKEYSRLQGELMSAGLNVRTRHFKLMELYLYDFPVAVRSEMDDLYKTVYELKKKIKNLEKQVKDLSGEEVAA